MTTKTRLIYCICAAMIGFYGAPTKATNQPNKESNAKGCTHEELIKYVDCYSTHGNAGHEEFETCRKNSGLSDSKQIECHKNMFDKLKDEVSKKDD